MLFIASARNAFGPWLDAGSAGIVAIAMIVVVRRFLTHISKRDEQFANFIANDMWHQRHECHQAMEGLVSALNEVKVALMKINGNNKHVE